MDNRYGYDHGQPYPPRSDTNASSTYSRTEPSRSDTYSSTHPLISPTGYHQPDYEEDPVPMVHHSATFYPTGNDDYFGNPYAGDWTDDVVETPATYTSPPNVYPSPTTYTPPPRPVQPLSQTTTQPSVTHRASFYDEQRGGWVTQPVMSPPVAAASTAPTTVTEWDEARGGWVIRPVGAALAASAASVVTSTPSSQVRAGSMGENPYNRPASIAISDSTPPPLTSAPRVYSQPAQEEPRQASFASSPYILPPVAPMTPLDSGSITSNITPASTSASNASPTPVNSDSQRSAYSTPSPPVLTPPIPPTPINIGLSVQTTAPQDTSTTPITPVEGGIQLSTFTPAPAIESPSNSSPSRNSGGIWTPPMSEGPSMSRSSTRSGIMGRIGSIRGSRNRTSTGFRGSMLPVAENEVVKTNNDATARYSDGGTDLKEEKSEELVYDENVKGWVKPNLMRRATTAMGRKGASLARSMTRFRYGQVSSDDELQLRRAPKLQQDEERAAREGYTAVDFGDFAGELPSQTAEAMRSKQGNTEFAYTGTGEAVDLSTLQGYLGGSGDGEDGEDYEHAPLTRATTGLGKIKEKEEQSYYFPEDPDMPNWKPVTMRPLYLSILQLLALGIMGSLEYLYQYSVDKGKQNKSSPFLTKFKNVDEMPLLDFAMWKYLPTVIAVTFGVLVQLADAEVKRVEPYFQLSRRPKGATAANSLNVEYLTFWAILCPLQAIKHRHWAILLSSVAAILSFAAVPPLLTVFLDLNPDKDVRIKHPHIEKEIVVHHVWTRLLEVVLLLIFLIIGGLQIMLLRRRTGLLGDPSGIAGVAAMANKSHILMDFKGLDEAGTDEIHKQLRKRTYILHKSSLWQAKFLKESERPKTTVKRQNAHPPHLRFVGAVPLMVYLMGNMAIIPLLLQLEDSKALRVLQNSGWFLTALSISIKMFWEVIDRDLRILQPFYMLYWRNAHSDVLTLDYTATIPGWVIFKTARNKHYLLTFITTITLFNEVLTVCMGSLGQGGGKTGDTTGTGGGNKEGIRGGAGEESTRSTTISLVLAELIIGTQIVAICLLLHLRRKSFLPRQPGTISSVLAYIYQSHMLRDFAGMEKATTDQRRKMLAALEPKRTYGFGWFKGAVDGQWHLGIDRERLDKGEVNLARGYKFGEKFTDAVLQTVPTGLDYL